MMKGAFNIANDPLGEIEMRSAWSMHKEVGLLYHIRNIRACESEIL
jgi:hypothetical protein